MVKTSIVLTSVNGSKNVDDSIPPGKPIKVLPAFNVSVVTLSADGSFLHPAKAKANARTRYLKNKFFFMFFNIEEIN
jgi:hypothetical protein